MNIIETSTYHASKDSVKKAMELFKDVKRSAKRRNPDKDSDRDYSSFCCQTITNVKKKSAVASFLPTFAYTEMRLRIMRHDWINLQRLFPLLLEISLFRETMVWRYAFAILLHSPMSSAAHLEEFLNMCLGCQNDNIHYVINQLVTLRDNNKKRSCS